MMQKDSARLFEELRHRDPEEKVEWIRSLADPATPESLEVLLDVLKQESWFLRDQAARVLATLGEDVVDPLIEYLSSGLWYTRSAAASALGRMGVPVAAAPLVGLLRDANRTVRDAAWDALVLLSRNDVGLHAVADAVFELPERAQRFALDGFLTRDPDTGQELARLLADPSMGFSRDSERLARAVNQEEGLSWDDVVGGGSAGQQSR
jgi:HEAT repeat protein